MTDTIRYVIHSEIIGIEACQSIQTVSMLTNLVLVSMPDIVHYVYTYFKIKSI